VGASNLTTYHLLLTTYSYHLPLTTYHLPLTTYHLPLTTYHLPLTTYHLPLTTYHLLLTRAAHRVTHLHARAAAAARARATPLPAQGKWVSREIPRATWLARYTIPAPPTLQHRLTLTCLLAYLLTAQGAVGHPHAAAAVARLPHAQKPPRRRARNRAAPASARDARSQEQRARRPRARRRNRLRRAAQDVPRGAGEAQPPHAAPGAGAPRVGRQHTVARGHTVSVSVAVAGG
jgi:hypothetical protein